MITRQELRMHLRSDGDVASGRPQQDPVTAHHRVLHAGSSVSVGHPVRCDDIVETRASRGGWSSNGTRPLLGETRL
jgi:hypothetical protein